jgi:hypothetical protein
MPRTHKPKPAPMTQIPAAPHVPAPDLVVPPSKISRVLEMLQRPSGAALGELVAATGWLPHTTRAALTGLRKRGYTLDKQSREGVTVYIIAKAA